MRWFDRAWQAGSAGFPSAHTSLWRPMTLLRVEGLTRRFGGVVAVDDVSFAVGAGEIVGLIGPNGRQDDRHQSADRPVAPLVRSDRVQRNAPRQPRPAPDAHEAAWPARYQYILRLLFGVSSARSLNNSERRLAHSHARASFSPAAPRLQAPAGPAEDVRGARDARRASPSGNLGQRVSAPHGWRTTSLYRPRAEAARNSCSLDERPPGSVSRHCCCVDESSST
jgi:hypothetical protein